MAFFPYYISILKKMFFGVQEKMIEEKRYNFLQDNFSFHYDPNLLNEFLIDVNIINNINSIDFHKFKYLIERWDLWNNIENLKIILQNNHTVSVINSIDLKKLYLLDFDDNKYYTHLITTLINDENALDGLNLIDFEKLKLSLNYDENFTIYILEEIIKNKHTVNAINSLSIKKCKIICKNGKFNGGSFLKVLKNLNNINLIKSISNKHLKFLLNNGKFCAEFLGKHDFPQSAQIELLINDDKYYHDTELFSNYYITDFNKIDFERLRLIIESDLFDSMSLMELIECEETIDLFNLFDVNKLRLLLNDKTCRLSKIFLSRKLYCNNMCHKCWNDADDYSLNIILEDPIFIKQFIVDVVSIQKYFDVINSVEIEKLALMLKTLDCRKNMKNLSVYKFILTMRHPVDLEKLAIISEKYDIFDLVCEPEIYKKTFNYIELINIEKLKILVNMLNYKDFVRILPQLCNDDIKQNLNFAIALHNVGLFKKVNFGFIINRKAIDGKIMQLFPEKFPIDQILIPPSLKNEGVSHLKYLALIASIGLINEQLDESE